MLTYLTTFLTGVADSWIARHFSQITELRRIPDPLADKPMTFTVTIYVTADNIIPLWAVVIFSSKELTMVTGGRLMYQKLGDVTSSNWLDETSADVFFVVCAAPMLPPAIPCLWVTGLISLVLALALAALCSYIFQYRKTSKKRKQA